MIEKTTEEILNAVKELIAHDSTISSLKVLIEKKLKDVYQDGYNEAEVQRAIDEAGEDY
jgi:methionine salvage enolase-phosphatase E1